MSATNSPNKDAGGAAATEQPFPPPLNHDTLQYRLDTGIIGKVGGQRGSLTRCAQKFGTFQSKLIPKPASAAGGDTEAVDDKTNAAEAAKVNPAEVIETTKNDLSLELELYRIEATKLLLSSHNMSNEVVELSQEYDQTQSLIEQEQQLVKQLQEQVSHALERKNCHLEYETLAKLTMTDKFSSQPKRTLKKEISNVETQLSTLNTEMNSLQHEVQIRDSQYQLLMQYMLDMKRSIQQDNAADDHEDDHNTKSTGLFSTSGSTPAGSGRLFTSRSTSPTPPAGAASSASKKRKHTPSKQDDDEEGAVADPMQLDNDDSGGGGDDDDGLYGDL